MKELTFGKRIQAKRKAQGLTQEQLALAMSVSKSSVSKWENNQTYPDIVLLPALATFFNVTIDELLGYAPQLTKSEIVKIYQKFSLEFSQGDPADVIAEVEKHINKYYACLPFLLQMSLLYINHYNLLASQESQQELLERSLELLVRVQSEAENPSQVNQSMSLMAVCYMQLGQAEKVLVLLGSTIEAELNNESILASAYLSLGQPEKSREILQVINYQAIQTILGSNSQLLLLAVGDRKKFAEILKRTSALIEVFDLKKLHPFNVISFLVNLLTAYLQQERLEAGLEILAEILAILKTVSYPLKIQGDDYYDLLDKWITEEMGLATSTVPRNEHIVKESLLTFLNELPLIQKSYENCPDFKRILSQFEKELS